MYESDKPYAKANEAMQKNLAKVPQPPQMPSSTVSGDAGYAARQSCKALLLEHAERMRREANQLENLASIVEQIHGDAENTLWRLLQGDFSRR